MNDFHQVLVNESLTVRYEDSADGGVDAVAVDAWGDVVARCYGGDRAEALARLGEHLAAPKTDWL